MSPRQIINSKAVLEEDFAGGVSVTEGVILAQADFAFPNTIIQIHPFVSVGNIN